MPHKIGEHQPGGKHSSKQALIGKSPVRLTGALKEHLGYKVVEGNNNWVQHNGAKSSRVKPVQPANGV